MASKIQLYKSRANICAAYASDVAFAVSGYPCWRTKAAALVIALFWDTCLFAASQNDNTKEYLTCVSNAEGVTEKMLTASMLNLTGRTRDSIVLTRS
jgi:hypothetical protein